MYHASRATPNGFGYRLRPGLDLRSAAGTMRVAAVRALYPPMSRAAAPKSPVTSWLRRGLALLLGVVLSLVLLEGVCQVYAVFLGMQWEKLSKHPHHYWTDSPSAALGYELARNVNLEVDGRVLRINTYGIREADDEIHQDKVRIAIFGDSVAFGLGLSQDSTISAMLQRKLDPEGRTVKVLNLGAPGYGTAELLENLRIKNEIYHLNSIYYVLSPNDFCRRNTSREGGDNGLYRMYHLPLLKSPWMVRKAIYRLRKGETTTGSTGWYQWLYDDGGEEGCADIAAMAKYAAAQGASFTVFLLPGAIAYQPGGGYALKEMYDSIMSFLKHNGIAYIDPIAAMAADPDRYFTSTNHLHPPGNELVADLLREHIGSP